MGQRNLRFLKRIVQAVTTAIAALLAAHVSWSAPAPTNGVPDVFALRSLDWLPAPVKAPFQPVRFPASVRPDRVEHMVSMGGRLWIAARMRGGTNAAGVALWSLSLPDGRLDPVRGQLERHAIRDLHAGPDGLWLAVDGGAAALDPRTLVLDPFSASEGLTTGSGVAFAYAGRRWFLISDSGALFVMHADGRSWSRLPGIPGVNARRAGRFERLGGSGDWLLALAPDELAVRHHAAPQWDVIDEKQWSAIPSATPPRWTSVAADGDGGFWLGSDLGLHFVTAETGSMQHQLAVRSVKVPGGLGVQVPVGFQASSAAYATARVRQAEGIRERMRVRARLGRMAVETGRSVDPMQPGSRIPGGVTALLRDGSYFWVACQDPTNSTRSRILLWHASSRRWVGQAHFGLPVSALAADESHLWIGAETGSLANAAPVVRLDKRVLTAIPATRWVPDEIRPDELGAKLAELPVRERAVHAFFAGDAQRAVELLDATSADAESLFIRAFAHDAIGLNQPARRDAFLDRLFAEFPDSPHAEAVRSLRPRKPVAVTEGVVPPALELLFKRRDANGDGRIDSAEWKAWKGDGADMKAFDADGNGALSLPEFDAVLRGTP